MQSELLGVIVSFVLVLLLAYPLGKYIAKVFQGQRTITDFMHPLERLIFRFSGIDPNRKMNWKDFLKAMLTINLLWFVYAFVLLLFQGHLPLNPDHNPGQTADLSFNTAISFMVNCDLQDYSGESGLTYLTQIFVVTFLQFVSAATGIAAVVALFNGIKEKSTANLGNFWNYFVKTITRIFLPLCLIVAVILAFNGTPTSFEGKDTVITMRGDTVNVSRGPAAGMIAIKHLGTNGGGWFNANSAHPLENPNYLTNMVEMMAQILIPVAMVFALGFYTGKRRFAFIIFAIMTVGALILIVPSMVAEIGGNPALAKMGIAQPTGSMEGKEVRFGPAYSGFWG